jgi:hypothetical protein
MDYQACPAYINAFGNTFVQHHRISSALQEARYGVLHVFYALYRS